MKSSLAGLVAGAMPSVASAESPSSKKELAGQVVLVTGAARGLGRELALACAKRGAKLILLDIARDVPEIGYKLATKADLAATAKKCRDVGVDVVSVESDVRDRKALERALAPAVAKLGSVDVLFSNAGVIDVGPFEDATERKFRTVVDINLVGAANVAALVIPGMKKKNVGRIVFVGSSAARGAMPSMASYVASKWGLVGLCKALALELAGTEITVNAVCPFRMDTPMGGDRKLDPKEFAQIPSPTLPRAYVPSSEVAEAALFFTTEAARSISAEVMDVAAGANARWSG